MFLYIRKLNFFVQTINQKNVYGTHVGFSANLKEDISENYQKDQIFSTFLPDQRIISPEESAKNVITPEVVEKMGQKGQLGLVKLWIREANVLARESVSIVRGSPLLETTCCLDNIMIPGEFWKKVKEVLPELSKRQLIPNQQGQFLVTQFNPREDSGIVAETDKELYYRLFLKYCFICII